MQWHLLHPQMTPEHLGFIPDFFSDDDPRPAAEQIADNYAHGGGYRPMQGWDFNQETASIEYAGDPPHRPLARTTLHAGEAGAEEIYFYDSAWVCIVQFDGTFAVTRMD